MEFDEGEGKVPFDNIAKRAAAYKPKERATYKMIKEYIEAKCGFKVHTAYIAEVKRDFRIFLGNLMKESIYRTAEKISKLYQEAYDSYLPLVEDVCSREISEDGLSYILDYLLNFVCDEKILVLYKKVCRKYLYVYPGCVEFYIEAYREM